MESFSLLISEPSTDPSVAQHRGHHMAKSHDDTSAGAVHQYQDEHGKFTSPFSTRRICLRDAKIRCKKVGINCYVSRRTFSPTNHVPEFLRPNVNIYNDNLEEQ